MIRGAYKWAGAAILVGVVAAIACSNNNGPGPGGKGLCVNSCPKTCSQDSDCPSSNALCCDFGKNGKACTTPQLCAPARFCTDDSKCNTAGGETCCAANPLQLDQKVCVAAAACKKSCGTDNDCAGSTTPKCCGLYAKPICTTVQACPNTCAQSTDCNTMANETCCTSVKAIPIYKDVLAGNVNGVCLPQGSSCPKTCAQSTECDTTRGELCCNGFCATSCTKACDSNNDCDTSKGQFCCNSGALASPWYGFVAMTPPPECNGGRCNRQANCTGAGQVCCGNTLGLDGGNTCGQNCVSTCRTAAQCTGGGNVVCP